MHKDMVKAYVATLEDAKLIDNTVGILENAVEWLDPNCMAANREFMAGCAWQEVGLAVSLLKAYREKKFGEKGPSIL